MRVSVPTLNKPRAAKQSNAMYPEPHLWSLNSGNPGRNDGAVNLEYLSLLLIIVYKAYFFPF